MTLFLNPLAGGATAERRWAEIRPAVERQTGPLNIVRLEERRRLDEAVSYAFHDGERRFVACGGDGTVNALLSSLMRFRGHPGFPRLVLGAVGLGSSNDFHKQGSTVVPAGNPYRIDFTRTLRQDIGVIDVNTRGRSLRRYFIVNASLGVTASGNAIFNGRGLISALKQFSVTTAISWAALKAILHHVNIDVLVSFDGGQERRAFLSNLAVLKNPNISGELRAAVGVSADDGRLGVWMEEDLSRTSLVKLFLGMKSGRFFTGTTSTIGSYSSVRVRGAEDFYVEFDGETESGNDVEFSLLPGCLEVCQ
jgi:diacylglycerol kinase (ATP)